MFINIPVTVIDSPSSSFTAYRKRELLILTNTVFVCLRFETRIMLSTRPMSVILSFFGFKVRKTVSKENVRFYKIDRDAK